MPDRAINPDDAALPASGEDAMRETGSLNGDVVKDGAHENSWTCFHVSNAGQDTWARKKRAG